MAEYITNYTPAPNVTDYYAEDSSRKGKDFMLGFFGMGAMLFIINTIIYLSLSRLANGASSSLALFNVGFSFLIFLIGIILAFAKNRRYIGIGIISLILVPLLIFGACLITVLGISSGRLF